MTMKALFYTHLLLSVLLLGEDDTFCFYDPGAVQWDFCLHWNSFYPSELRLGLSWICNVEKFLSPASWPMQDYCRLNTFGIVLSLAVLRCWQVLTEEGILEPWVTGGWGMCLELSWVLCKSGHAPNCGISLAPGPPFRIVNMLRDATS